MGLQDGSIRIQPILLGDFASLHDYWMMGVHDSLYGDITSLCLSNDGKMLFSVGLDGNFFSFWFEERLESELQLAASIPSPIVRMADCSSRPRFTEEICIVTVVEKIGILCVSSSE